MNDLDCQLRAYYDEMVRRIDPFSPAELGSEPARRGPRGLVVAGIAAAAVLILGAATFLLIGNRSERVDEAATSPQETAMPPSETTAPAAPPTLFGQIEMETFGDFTFAWDQHEIWRYVNGEWSLHAPAPKELSGLAYTSGTLWAITDAPGLQYLDDGSWRETEVTPPWRAGRPAAAPDTGVLWMSTGADLYRWDGTAWTGVAHPPTWEEDGDDGGVGDGYVGGIAVTSDGTVWAAGLHGYFPQKGGLSRYDDATGTWEAVRPRGGEEDIPAALMVPTSDGGLWVVLADWHEDWGARVAAGDPPAVLTLARYDGTTGEWQEYEEDLPPGHPSGMASGGDSVWISRAGKVDGFPEASGIARFDGHVWTTYLEDLPVDDTVDDITVAADGTVWYTVNGEIYLLVP